MYNRKEVSQKGDVVDQKTRNCRAVCTETGPGSEEGGTKVSEKTTGLNPEQYATLDDLMLAYMIRRMHEMKQNYFEQTYYGYEKDKVKSVVNDFIGFLEDSNEYELISETYDEMQSYEIEVRVVDFMRSVLK
jgi:hypothetical protein